MDRRSKEVVVPKNGHMLKVLVICRISGCARQKEASIEDQEDNARQSVAEIFDGPTHFEIIATKAKGEALDRPELERIATAYRSGEYDLVMIDDLSRLIRGGEAARLLGLGVDRGTRTVCLQDGVDTLEATWEQMR